MSLASGGSITDALKAAAFSFAQPYIWGAVGGALAGAGVSIAGAAMTAANVGATLVKSAVHGIIDGAISLAQAEYGVAPKRCRLWRKLSSASLGMVQNSQNKKMLWSMLLVREIS